MSLRRIKPKSMEDHIVFFQQHIFGKCIEFYRAHKNLSSSGVSHLPWLAKWFVIFGNDAKYYSIRECTQKRVR
jgi:hypothetical protein